MKDYQRRLLQLLPDIVEQKYYQRFFLKEHKTFQKENGEGPASNLSKQQVLKLLRKSSQCSILVETGTYLGDTLYALYNNFDNLYSIELSSLFYQKATKRFKKMSKIRLLQGDSGKVLKQLVPTLKGSAIFWLDGHYSGGLTAKGEKECPVFEELLSIFSSPLEHYILIDDARLFIGQNDYPTLDELKHFVEQQKPDYSFVIANDAIRLMPG